MNEVRFLGAMPPEVFIGAVVVAKLALDLPLDLDLDLRDELSAILHAR